ncbi:MAG: PspC domain-containing protein [Bowdeniella nasicola]|nr:PspC domain-containing protein [Bowdeniella nasicola]
MESFYDSLRRAPLRRTEDRVIGGVCAGLAHRLGVAPLAMRLLAVLAMVIGGLPLVLYAVAWALIPEHRDGRIHLQELFAGRPNAGVAGAAGMLIIGLSRPLGSFALGLRHSVLGELLGLAIVVTLAVGAVWVAGRSSRSGAPRSSTDGGAPGPWGSEPSAPHTVEPAAPWPQPATDPSSGHAGNATVPTETTPASRDALPSAGTTPASGAQGLCAPGAATSQSTSHGGGSATAARSAYPVASRPPALATNVILAIIAAAIGAGALALLVMERTYGAWLVAGGATVGVLALGLLWAAVRGRRGSWLTAATWLTGLPLLGATALALVTPAAVLTDPHALPVAAVASSQGTSRASFIGYGELTDPREDVSLTSVFASPRLVNRGEPVRITITAVGAGAVNLDTLGGWQVIRNGEVTTLPPATILTRSEHGYDGPPMVQRSWSSFTIGMGESMTLVSPEALEAPAEATSIDLTFAFGGCDVTTSYDDEFAWLEDHLNVDIPPEASEPDAASPSPSPTTPAAEGTTPEENR